MENPKLALIPSGYKSGKVYSILPNDATGDFDFERQSIGTRVRKDGLIEEAKTVGSITNLQPRSEEFDNSVWTKTRTTITADQELAPNGTNTADKLTGDGTGTSYVYDALNFTYPQKYTISIFVKPINVTTFSIQKFAGGTGVAFFDLSTGTISSAPTGTMSNPIIESLSNGWFRCSVEHIPTTTGSHNYGFGMQVYSGDQFYIWGAMVSEGALSDYIKTEGTTETKRVETFTDVPRLDWLNSNCPSLLLEPQRTQLATYNTNITSANGYALTNGTLEENTTIAPDGTLTASTFKATADNGRFQKVKTGGTIGSEYTVSAYVKRKKGTGQVYIRAVEFGNILVTATDEWTRVSATVEATSTNIRYGMALENADEEIYVWGFQVEEAPYASSFIYNTATGTVTRLKDTCTLLNQTLFTNYPFTVYAKAKVEAVGNTVFSLVDSTNSNTYLLFYFSSSTQVGVLRRTPSASDTDFYNFTYSVGDIVKVAVAFINDTSYKLYINGNEIADVISGASITFQHDDICLGQLRIASDTGTRNSIDDFRVYDYTLTDTQLIELTK